MHQSLYKKDFTSNLLPPAVRTGPCRIGQRADQKQAATVGCPTSSTESATAATPRFVRSPIPERPEMTKASRQSLIKPFMALFSDAGHALFIMRTHLPDEPGKAAPWVGLLTCIFFL